ncbi:hypothetical protein HK097_006468, partial [Rhizophlyctis rosea]
LDPVGSDVLANAGEEKRSSEDVKNAEVTTESAPVLATSSESTTDAPGPSAAVDPKANGVGGALGVQQPVTVAESDTGLLPTMCGNVGKCPLHEGWEFIKSREVQVDIDEQLHLLKRDRNEANGIKLRLRRRRAIAKAGLMGSV